MLDHIQSRKLIIIIATAFFLFISYGTAQPQTGKLKGKVINAKTRETLWNATVFLVGTDIKILTDKEGNFFMANILPGRYTVEVSSAGFEKVMIRNIVISADKTSFLNVELQESLPQLKENITVYGKPISPGDPYVVSVVNVGSVEATKMPGSVRDISRVLSTFPGTSNVNEISNDLIVRGGSPWENGFFIDNIQVPNINHYQSQGGSGGLIGILDVSLVKQVNFYTGGFSAVYGDRMSSIVDIKLRNGSKDEIKASLNLNTAGFGGSLEGPFFKGKGSWILALRRSYHDIITKVIGYGVSPRFGDVHFKLSHQINPRNKISILNIYGDSRLSYDLETAIEEGINNALTYRTSQNTLGINWFSNWSQRGYSNTSLSYSFFKSSYSISNAGLESAGMEYIAADEFNGALEFKNINVYQLNNKFSLEFGLEFKMEKADFNNYFAEYMDRWEIMRPAFANKGVIETEKSGLFFSCSLNPLGKIQTTLGVRIDYFSYNKHIHFSPRLSSSLNINERLTLTGAFGVYYQTVPVLLLSGGEENRENRDPFVTHFILGLKYNLSKNTLLSLDIYNKNYKNMPLDPMDPGFFVMDSGVEFGFFRPSRVLYDTGIAFSRGVELLIQKRLRKDFYGIISVSIFRSRFRNHYGKWLNRLNDNQYVFNVVGGYKPSDKWDFSVRLNLAGGIPYTPFDIDRSKKYNSGISDSSIIDPTRYPKYFTLNIRVDRQFKFENSCLDIFLSMINLLNRKNVARYYWNKLENDVGIVYQSPILPIFGIEYKF